jgi:hypothetical protein
MNNLSICLFLGMWIFLSGFIKELHTSINLTLSGLAAMGIGLYNLLILKKWCGLLTGTLGMWIFLSGYVFGIIIPFNFIFIGFILSIIGFSRICIDDEESKPISDSFRERIKNRFRFIKN